MVDQNATEEEFFKELWFEGDSMADHQLLDKVFEHIQQAVGSQKKP